MSFYASGNVGGTSSSADSGDLPKALRRKLQMLGYPEIGEVKVATESYSKLVLWLEEEKIRFYEPRQRKGLRDFGNNWLTALSRYAQELDIPSDRILTGEDEAKLRVLNGLVNSAVQDVYRDKLEDQSLVLSMPPKPVSGGLDGKPQLQELLPDLNRLLEQYSLPKLPAGAADTETIAALQCLKTRMCHVGKGRVELDLENLPIAAAIDDPEVRKAAGMLRLLHNIEMGQLQVNVNQVLNELQQLTANPKTDAKLGKVGT